MRRKRSRQMQFFDAVCVSNTTEREPFAGVFDLDYQGCHFVLHRPPKYSGERVRKDEIFNLASSESLTRQTTGRRFAAPSGMKSLQPRAPSHSPAPSERHPFDAAAQCQRRFSSVIDRRYKKRNVALQRRSVTAVVSQISFGAHSAPQ